MAQKKKQSPSEEIKRFVSINEYNPEGEQKLRLVWIIVSVFVIILVIFWFWSIKQRMNDRLVEKQDDLNIAEEFNSAVDKAKNNFNEIQNTIKDAAEVLQEKADVNNIKNDVLSKIQNNLDKFNLSEYSSETVSIALKYPDNWTVEETGDYLTLSSNLVTTSTTTTIGSIKITKHNNSENLELEPWALKNKTAIVSDWSTTEDWLTEINSQPILIYENITDQETERVVILSFEDRIYEIELLILNNTTDENNDNNILEIEKILESITLLENN